mgnify:CR=1 FL=1
MSQFIHWFFFLLSPSIQTKISKLMNICALFYKFFSPISNILCDREFWWILNNYSTCMYPLKFREKPNMADILPYEKRKFENRHMQRKDHVKIWLGRRSSPWTQPYSYIDLRVLLRNLPPWPGLFAWVVSQQEDPVRNMMLPWKTNQENSRLT